MGGNGRSEIIVADCIEKLLLSIIGCTMMDHRCCCFFLRVAIFPIFLISSRQSPASLNFDALAGWIDDDDDGELSVSDIAGYVELIGKPLRGRGVEGIREKFKLVYGATGGDYRLLRDKLIGWIVKLIGEKLRERIKDEIFTLSMIVLFCYIFFPSYWMYIIG